MVLMYGKKRNDGRNENEQTYMHVSSVLWIMCATISNNK